MTAAVPQTEPEPTPRAAAAVRSNCPHCEAELAVLRIIAGRGGAEYRTMRCTRCGGVHLDIVNASPPPHAIQDSADRHV
jgi:uncharacterized Zn finger protein